MKQRIWRVKAVRMPRQEKISEVCCVDINSAMEYVRLVDMMKDDDVRISLTSQTIWIADRIKGDINIPKKLICPNCGEHLKLAERCPNCGQLFEKF